jgi:hypothetical protein
MAEQGAKSTDIQLVTPHERVAITNEALQELARKLVIACDVIAVHRDVGGRLGGRERKWASLRYGAFLLAYAPFEAFFDELTDYRATKNRNLGTSRDRIRGACQKRLGISDATSLWKARMRVPPLGAFTRTRWETLEGERLTAYLSDMMSLRNLLSHGADPTDVTNESKTLWPLANGKFSMRLTSVEGFIWAVEDIATCTGLAIAGKEVVVPDWPRPLESGISSRGRPGNPYKL